MCVYKHETVMMMVMRGTRRSEGKVDARKGESRHEVEGCD